MGLPEQGAPGRVVARIVVDLMDDGGLSISGNVGDMRLAKNMLESAVASIDGRAKITPSPSGLVVPSRDAPVTPDEARFPLGPVVAR